MAKIDDLLGVVSGEKTFDQIVSEKAGTTKPDDTTLAQFDEAQVQQLQLAEEKGLFDTDCKKHPEWSSTFMNIHINREAKGESLDTLYLLADYLSKNPLPEDKKWNKIGVESTPTLLLLQMLDLGMELPESYPTKEDGTFDKTMFYYMCYTVVEKAKGAELLTNGRLAMGDWNFIEMPYLMSEGNAKAYEIIQALSQMNSNETERFTEMSKNPMDRIAENAWVHMNINYSIDDMGIRGKQLIDALEYADGSSKRLWELVNKSDAELVKYVNYKAACRIRDGSKEKEYLAVTSGASFDRFHKNPADNPWQWRNPDAMFHQYTIGLLNYEEYLEEVKPLTIDWATMDIKQGISLEQAKRICEARGFELVRSFCRGEHWGETVYYYLYRNRTTGDHIEFSSATEKDATYGGVAMMVYRISGVPWELADHCSSGGTDDGSAHYYQFTHHNGVFRTYDKLATYATPDKINWKGLGFSSYGLPIPKYWKEPFHRTGDLYQKIGGELSQMWEGLGSFHVQLLINTFLMIYDKENFNLEVFPELEYFWEVPYDAGISHMQIFDYHAVYEAIVLTRLVLAWLQAPKEVIEKWDDAIKRRCEEVHRIKTKQAEDNPFVRRELNENPTTISLYEKYAHILYDGIPNEAHVIEKLEMGNLAELPVKLPWVK